MNARKNALFALFAAALAVAAPPAAAATRPVSRGTGPAPEAGGFARQDRAAAPAPKEPYHLFGAPRKDTAAEQFARAERLEKEGARSAARSAYEALVHNWGASPEASAAQLAVARLHEAAQEWEEAFREYEYYLKHYAGTAPVPGTTYEAVVASQYAIANTLRAALGPSPFAPSAELVASMYRHVVANAPDAPRAPEAVFGEGAAYEADGAWDLAVVAYEKLAAKYPRSALVPAARYRAGACRYRLAKRYPNDEKTLRNALAALRLALRTDPAHAEAAEAAARADELSARQTALAFERAAFYERVRRDPAAARLAYGQFLQEFPSAPEAERARARLAALEEAAPAVP